MTADSLPGETVDTNSGDEEKESARLLKEVQEAFDGSRGEEDLRKALETIQVRHRLFVFCSSQPRFCLFFHTQFYIKIETVSTNRFVYSFISFVSSPTYHPCSSDECR